MIQMLVQDCGGLLSTDASNAFYLLNCMATLHNIKALCPPFAASAINFYSGDADLLVGGNMDQLTERTTQGEPLSMLIYTIKTVPLFRSAESEETTQTWFADDA